MLPPNNPDRIRIVFDDHRLVVPERADDGLDAIGRLLALSTTPMRFHVAQGDLGSRAFAGGWR